MNRLSHKEKGFVKDIAKGLPGVQAALNNYDTKDYSTAGVIAHENLNKPKIKKALEEVLGEDMLIEKHEQLLNAVSLEKLFFDEYDEDEVIEEVISKMAGYELLHIVTRLDKEGNVISKFAYVKAPDNNTQDKALDKAYKVTGRYAPEKHVNLNVQVKEPSQRLKDLAKKLNG